ncbi:MAG TPA: hypothetical protein PK496_09495 [Bacteroidales bacterium]|nr:hypothetical protein [Bacteroidales bacterium]
MKTKVITEFVKMEVLQTTTEEQLLAKTEIINQFLRKQDGFIDAELVKAIEGNVWFLIYHIENFEKLKAVGEKLRAMKLFDEIIPLIEPGSMSVSFYQKIKTW